MPLNVFEEQVDATHNISVLTPAKIVHQTRQFNSSLANHRFESMDVTITNVKLTATKDGQEIDLEKSNFDITLQMIPCAQTTIRDELHRCKLSAYKEIDLIKIKSKRAVVSIDKRGPLVLRVIIKDEDPKNPLPQEDLKGFRLRVQYTYSIKEKHSSFGNPRAQTKALDELRSALSNAMSQIRSLGQKLASTKEPVST
tara:strand:- start:192 stop:785 length:594 start_codon:yes stop_codon:yes gene_type:complete